MTVKRWFSVGGRVSRSGVSFSVTLKFCSHSSRGKGVSFFALISKYLTLFAQF